MTELAGVMVGNYFLLECLTRDSLVEMYRARPTLRGGYDVILRLFRPGFPDPTAFREHFGNEVEKVWRCHHPHIMPLLEYGTGEDLLYCVTLWPEGEGQSLQELLAHHQRQLLPIGWVVRLAQQLCSALQYAHDHDIVHGNMQPSSIFIRNSGDTLLTNFGMRHAYRYGEPLVSLLYEGNPAYMAPEQSLGMIRAACDIYALGVLLYRLLSGVLPFDAKNPGDMALRHTSDPVPSLRSLRPEVPMALENVIHVALSKDAAARFPTAHDFAQALFASTMPADAQRPQALPALPQGRVCVRAKRTPFTWARAVPLIKDARMSMDK